jgi:hypothetical protein
MYRMWITVPDINHNICKNPLLSPSYSRLSSKSVFKWHEYKLVSMFLAPTAKKKSAILPLNLTFEKLQGKSFIGHNTALCSCD